MSNGKTNGDWAILDNKEVVFVVWIGKILARISNGVDEITVSITRLNY
jgi:isopenicillin N synthase-like dioxygenase